MDKGKNKRRFLRVVVIDLGDVSTTVAFSYVNDPFNVGVMTQYVNGEISQRQYTCALIKPDGHNLHSYGYDAQLAYSELMAKNKHKQWYFYSSLQLGSQWNVTMLDASNKRLPTKTVVALFIRNRMDTVLKNSRLTDQKDYDTLWIFPVFANCNETTKQLLRDSAYEAGISEGRCLVVSGPEVVMFYCRHMTRLGYRQHIPRLDMKSGRKYLVLDSGQNMYECLGLHEMDWTPLFKDTANASVVQITDDGSVVRESHGTWTYNTPIAAYSSFLTKLFGERLAQDKEKSTMLDNFKEKMGIEPQKSGKITFKISAWCHGTDIVRGSAVADHVVFAGDKIRVDADIVKGFLHECTASIIDHAAAFIDGCSAIIMVGVLSDAPILKEAVKNAFPEVDVIVPEEPSFAMIKGAVIFGHCDNKQRKLW